MDELIWLIEEDLAAISCTQDNEPLGSVKGYESDKFRH